MQGVFDRAEPPVRGPKPRVLDDRDRRLAQPEQDKALLERKVHQQTLRAQKAEAQVAFQKKVACLLGADISELRDTYVDAACKTAARLPQRAAGLPGGGAVSLYVSSVAASGLAA
jgi:hypothetical protein